MQQQWAIVGGIAQIKKFKISKGPELVIRTNNLLQIPSNGNKWCPALMNRSKCINQIVEALGEQQNQPTSNVVSTMSAQSLERNIVEIQFININQYIKKTL